MNEGAGGCSDSFLANDAAHVTAVFDQHPSVSNTINTNFIGGAYKGIALLRIICQKDPMHRNPNIFFLRVYPRLEVKFPCLFDSEAHV